MSVILRKSKSHTLNIKLLFYLVYYLVYTLTYMDQPIEAASFPAANLVPIYAYLHGPAHRGCIFPCSQPCTYIRLPTWTSSKRLHLSLRPTLFLYTLTYMDQPIEAASFPVANLVPIYSYLHGPAHRGCIFPCGQPCTYICLPT